MLGIEYYGFALFVAILICLIAVLCKFLFADIKRQYKLLDERESKLLKLYQSVEDVMDDFSDQAAQARAEIQKLVGDAQISQIEALRVQNETLAMITAAGAAEVETEKARNTRSRTTSKPKAAAEPDGESVVSDGTKKKTTKSGAKAGGGASFQKMIDELDTESAGAELLEIAEPSRNETILALKDEGKSVQKIAQELGITQNEVKLVIGLNKQE